MQGMPFFRFFFPAAAAFSDERERELQLQLLTSVGGGIFLLMNCGFCAPRVRFARKFICSESGWKEVVGEKKKYHYVCGRILELQIYNLNI